jgi:LmbE family N-acetylglucosaminyl deacetylase
MSIKFSPNSVLALAPHPDDIELGLGGTINKLIENGSEVNAVIFSLADKSLPAGFSIADIRAECVAALESLGLDKSRVNFYDFPVREFDSHRQEILEKLVQLSIQLKPEVVFCPSLNDTHQDHSVIANECVRAFRKTTVLGYELPWNTKQFDSSLSVSLQEHHIEAKEKSLGFYLSQQGRAYFESGLIKNHSRMRATVAGLEYVESFELIRMVLK